MTEQPLTSSTNHNAAEDRSPSPSKKKTGIEKWDPSVLAHGYSQIPAILLQGQKSLDLSPVEMNLVLQLLSYWWVEGSDPHPAKDTIAKRMGLSSRQVQRHLTALETKSILTRVQRFKPHKGQDSNGYDFTPLMSKLKSLALEYDKAKSSNKKRMAKVEIRN